ncbi:maleylpyruvate isomerase family mycothiol-dependent enzyme [Microbispora sitophila]|uniref:maleylpyruvate isomerase family mycothiol-dependent enzyme n=1 Tax=Microbispora sitophila TaxID=2771537 RepID=UPI001D021880|nr:maleylpyruvate isomerase family mycothiol-dependent enzyme [Microbispora sitophila]
MDEEYWAAVRGLRLRVADLLEALSPAEWDTSSLCRGWRVRDVAGHLAIIPTITTWDLVAATPRAGFNPHRINTLIARRNGSRDRADLVAQIRRHADDRRTARVLDARDSLFDVIVHSQDIALPLGRDFPVPAEHSRRALRRVWEMGWPFNASRKLAGVTLRATDTGWSEGAGPEVAGPALALLLLATGRTAPALDSLHGPGIATLKPAQGGA